MKRNKSFSGSTPFYFVASPIGNLKEFSPRAIEVLLEADFICVEDTRISIKLLQHFKINKPLLAVHKFSEQAKVNEIITKLKAGQKGAFLSDAGYPLVSDPGDILLREMLENNIAVSVVNGPNALLPALILSNLNVVPFTFIGFLPAKEGERQTIINKFKYNETTLVFYEAPHRLDKTIATLFHVLGDRDLVIARELTKIHEEYIYTSLREYNETTLTLKGEIVLIVSGAKTENNHETTLYLEHVEKLIKENYSAKEAIKLVALLFNVKKNELYDLYVASKK